MKKITIIDYRAGNLASVQKAFEYLGCETVITDDPQIVRSAQTIVLPGVGHFGTMARLEQSRVKAEIEGKIAAGTPFLGICLGMQWLFEGSAEAPGVRGLGLFAGRCEHFVTGVKVPHVGWNNLEARGKSRLFAGVPHDGFVYYTHSYRAPVTDGVIATTHYGEPFAAAAERDNVYGVQFHPEKSSDIGLAILRNFCEAAC
ncbi:MAG TPA: imidazole glycerol phosphate synthase subunit HisH [Clostridia bacterium]|nr:imidazole glycerol phosphate synthase subunit HisH [Clostridia bacterium]